MTESSTGDVTVLHVDDDPDFAALAATKLEQADDRLTVETAHGATEAMERLEMEAVECIVSDYEMPGKDGIEFLDAVRERDSDLPFILFTGMGSEDIASEAISAGVTDYLQKGGGAEQFTMLANRIRNAVEGYRARRSVRESEQRLRRVYERITDGFLAVNREWEYTYVNEEGARLVGKSREAVLGERVWDVFPDIVGTPFEDALRTAMESQETTSLEEYYPSHGRWYNVHVYPAPDGISVYFQDCTDRRKRVAELELYESIVEHTEDGVYVFDADGDFEFVNRRVAEVSGIEQEDWKGENVRILADIEMLRDSEVAAVKEGIRSIVEDDVTEVFVELEPDVPGDVGVLDLRLTSLSDGAAKDWVVGFTRDVTDRKHRQRALERKNERLEEFANVLSHDLRNPLSVADGRLELAAEECESEHIEAVGAAHDRMRTLIDDVLTLAQEGATATDVDPVDLSSVVEECWETVETADATLAIETDRRIEADRARLQRLLENLMRNAVEHGGDTVTVTVGDLAEENGFFVADDGPGIDAAEPERVFEIEYSAGDAGTGFGLAIADEIATAHGWDIELAPAKASGACFEITGVEEPAD